ncbi:hypothetical protein FXO38_16419 [Capsicum annuum]|nr:hypothetical protein FXO38_16419 [Capsicum annuum]KAF3676647.1 hypothetical protein FXO37_05212 [Capsicum annuum]
MGRELPTDEVFEATHPRKKLNPIDEDVWVEPCAKVVHDEFRLLLGEYRSSLPPESQGDPIPQHVRNELWTKVSGPANRGHFYRCHTEYFDDNIRSSSGPAYSNSSVDAEIIDAVAAVQFFHSNWGVIPPCPGDVVRATKSLGPVDDFSTDDDMEDEDEFDDDDC